MSTPEEAIARRGLVKHHGQCILVASLFTSLFGRKDWNTELVLSHQESQARGSVLVLNQVRIRSKT